MDFVNRVALGVHALTRCAHRKTTVYIVLGDFEDDIRYTPFLPFMGVDRRSYPHTLTIPACH